MNLVSLGRLWRQGKELEMESEEPYDGGGELVRKRVRIDVNRWGKLAHLRRTQVYFDVEYRPTLYHKLHDVPLVLSDDDGEIIRLKTGKQNAIDRDHNAPQQRAAATL